MVAAASPKRPTASENSISGRCGKAMCSSSGTSNSYIFALARVTESNRCALASGLIGSPRVKRIHQLHERFAANDNELEVRGVEMAGYCRLRNQRSVIQG